MMAGKTTKKDSSAATGGNTQAGNRNVMQTGDGTQNVTHSVIPRGMNERSKNFRKCVLE